MTTATLTTLDLLAEKGIFPDRTNHQNPKDTYLFRCPLPGHQDNNPSFSVHSDQVQWKCFPCGAGGRQGKLLELMIGPDRYAPSPKVTSPSKLFRTRDNSQKPKTRLPLQGCTLAQLAEQKAIPIEAMKAAGWYDTDWHHTPAVAIPYKDGGLRYRGGLDARDRFRWAKGSKPWLYGLEQLDKIRAGGKAILVEGETDTLSGQIMGLPVLGVPGADTWKPEWAILLAGLEVLVWREPDTGGTTLLKNVAESFDDILVIEPPPGIKDLNSLLDQCGSSGAAREFFDDLVTEGAYYYAGDDPPEPEKPSNNLGSVPIREGTPNKITSLIGTFGNSLKHRKDKSAEIAALAWPDPAGCKPTLVGRLTISDGVAKARNLVGNTWSNPFNAQRHRRAKYESILPRLDLGGPYYFREFAADDCSDAQHESLTTRIDRAGGQYLRFNHIHSRHSYTYLSDLPGEDWQPIGNLSDWLIDALTNCQAPEYQPGQKPPGRYRPVIGSRSWTTERTSTSPESTTTLTVAVAPKGIDFKHLLAVLSVQFALEAQFQPANNPIQVGPAVTFRVADLRHAEDIALAAGMTLKAIGKKKPVGEKVYI